MSDGRPTTAPDERPRKRRRALDVSLDASSTPEDLNAVIERVKMSPLHLPNDRRPFEAALLKVAFQSNEKGIYPHYRLLEAYPYRASEQFKDAWRLSAPKDFPVVVPPRAPPKYNEMPEGSRIIFALSLVIPFLNDRALGALSNVCRDLTHEVDKFRAKTPS